MTHFEEIKKRFHLTGTINNDDIKWLISELEAPKKKRSNPAKESMERRVAILCRVVLRHDEALDPTRGWEVSKMIAEADRLELGGAND